MIIKLYLRAVPQLDSRDFFLFYPSRLPFRFIFVFHRYVMGGIPPPSRGTVGKNRSTRIIVSGNSLTIYYPVLKQTIWLQFRKTILSGPRNGRFEPGAAGLQSVALPQSYHASVPHPLLFHPKFYSSLFYVKFCSSFNTD